MTLEAWVKTTDAGTGRRRIISQQGGGYWLMALNNNVLEYGSSADGALDTSGPALNDGGWHHVVVVRNWTTAHVRSYVDGAWTGYDAQATAAPYAIDDPVFIGKYTGGSEFYGGLLDEIAVYNVALSPAQILQHYTLGTSAGGPTYRDLTGLAAGSAVASGSAQNYRAAEPLPTTGGLGHPLSMPGLMLLGAPLPASAGAAPLVGSSAGQATASGSLTAYRARYLVAASAGRATVSVALRAKRRLVASATGVSSTTALLGQFRYLVAASSGQATVSVTLTKKGAKYLVGLAAGQAVATGAVTAKGFKNLTAASSGQSTANGALTAYRARYLVATSNGQATAGGALRARRSLLGASSGAASSSGLVLRRRALVALAAGQASVVVTLAKYTLRPVSGSSAGTSSVSVTLRRVRSLTAAGANGIAVANAVVSIPPPQLAVIVEVAMVTGWASSILDLRPGTASSDDVQFEAPLVGAARSGG